jgi:hypothetical protein
VAHRGGSNRQRLDITIADGDLGVQMERLVSFGAARLDDGEDGDVVLADPDGNQFHVLSS